MYAAMTTDEGRGPPNPQGTAPSEGLRILAIAKGAVTDGGRQILAGSFVSTGAPAWPFAHSSA